MYFNHTAYIFLEVVCLPIKSYCTWVFIFIRPNKGGREGKYSGFMEEGKYVNITLDGTHIVNCLFDP